MGTAIYTGVTGLLAHQRRMDVVANNISNINTFGYRASRMNFQDLFSQTLQGGGARTGDILGTNPEQIGLGVVVGSIDIDFGQGSLFSTGVDSDLAIQGNGFFILSNGRTHFYTRDGSFARDVNGILVDPATGLRVQGYMADATGVIPATATLSDITIPIGNTSVVRATQNAALAGNLAADAAVGTQVSRTLRVYDSLGAERQIQIIFTRRDQVTDNGTTYNAWTWTATFNGTDVSNVPTGQTGCILFDGTGGFHSEGSIDGGGVFTARASLPSQNQISVPASAFTGPATPTTPFEFALNLSGTTCLSGSNDLTMISQDGYARGVLESFNVAGDGVIYGVFSNGISQVIGQVALAGFGNLGGLARAGDNLFAETPASGIAQIGAPGTGGLGSVSGGVLEGSNVDLGTEFSNMIVTQRGYQANARTVTAADTLLQEAVNLIR